MGVAEGEGKNMPGKEIGPTINSSLGLKLGAGLELFKQVACTCLGALRGPFFLGVFFACSRSTAITKHCAGYIRVRRKNPDDVKRALGEGSSLHTAAAKPGTHHYLYVHTYIQIPLHSTSYIHAHTVVQGTLRLLLSHLKTKSSTSSDGRRTIETHACARHSISRDTVSISSNR